LYIVINLITPRALFSPILLQSCSLFHESGSVNQFQRFEIFQHGLCRLLNLVQLAVEPHYTPTSPQEPHPRTKHQVDRITGCGDMKFLKISR